MRLILILLFLYNTPYMMAQEGNEVSEEVNEFFTFLDNFIKDFNKETGLLTKNYTREEALELAKKYYNAIAKDPAGYNKYILNEYYEHQNRPRERLSPDEINPTLKRGVFLQLLKEKLGDEFIEIIGIPYFLKINIIEIKHGVYISTDNIKFAKTNLICQIEDVIKGAYRFKQNDTVDIFLLNRWIGECDKKFEINQTYFIPLVLRNCGKPDCNLIALQILKDNNCGIYPIIKEKIYAPNDYFEISENIDWIEFKSAFLNKYVDIMEEDE